MKRIVLIIGLMLSASLFSQVDLGLKGGANTVTLSFDELVNSSDIQTITATNEFGYHIGMFTRIEVAAVYFQPEFLYTNINSTIQVETVNGITTSNFSLSRFDIPVNFGLKMGFFSLYGGPVLSYNLNQPTDILELNFNGGSLGYQAGIGMTFGNYIIDAKYEGSFKELADEVVINGMSYDVDSRTGQFIFSIGFALF